MIFKTATQEIDLSKITRVFPSAIVIDEGDRVQVSLEWIEEKKDKVKLECYSLVFDFDLVGEEIRNRVEVDFETKDELISAMQEVANLYEAKK
ncbi:MAG: hypothetical protein GQ570_06415 [Helicobacteraceae bacterium]|nr:hypothetical protein [Helicobacteraceae bacterium]